MKCMFKRRVAFLSLLSCAPALLSLRSSNRKEKVPRGWKRLFELGQICAMIVASTFMGQLARAGTITFNDLMDTLTVDTTDNRMESAGCVSARTSERCNVLDRSPYNPAGTFGGTLPDYVLIYDGKDTKSGLSDYISRVDVVK